MPINPGIIHKKNSIHGLTQLAIPTGWMLLPIPGTCPWGTNVTPSHSHSLLRFRSQVSYRSRPTIAAAMVSLGQYPSFSMFCSLRSARMITWVANAPQARTIRIQPNTFFHIITPSPLWQDEKEQP